MFILYWLIRISLIIFSKNLIFLLIRIEIINLSLACKILIIKNNYFKFFRFFKYYLLQSFFIYLILFSLLFFNYNKFRSIILLILLLSKINLFPRHLWVNEVFFSLDVKEIFLLGLVAKIPVILIILSIENLNYIIILSVLITFIWTIFNMKNFNHLNILISFSNLNSSCWIVVLAIRPPYVFLLFFFLYSNIIFSILYNNFLYSSNNNLITLRIINIARLPIRTMFFFKVVLLEITDLRYFFVITLLLINCYITYLYFKYILKLIKNIKINYNFKSSSYLFIYCCFSFIVFFFIYNIYFKIK